MALDTQMTGPRKALIIIAVVLSSLVVIAALFLPSLNVESTSLSHVSANVPNKTQFDALLTRDLEHYFKAKLQRDVSVTFRLLREQPTQSGMAFPKFYAWVVIRSRESGTEISQGAVRVGAEATTSFFVTDYISLAEMKANPGILNEVFPGPVVERIRMHF